MSAKDSKAIFNLLPRYCNGTATPEQADLVNEWIGESEENWKTVRQIHLLYLAADTMDVSARLDIEKALAEVRRKMTPEKGRKPNLSIWLQRVAAILFIPLLAALLLQQFVKDGERPAAQWFEVKTNPGMTTAVTLPDGTLVHLNSETSLRYPSAFQEDTRTVFLKGEGFFSVAENSEQPFIVSAPRDTRIEVVGTEFNVEAFETDSIVSATLIRGEVRFLYTSNTQRQISLLAGQKVVYNPALGEATVYETDGRTDTAWKDGKIVFCDTPLEEALRILAKRYNVAFTIKNDKLKQYSFTGNFDSQRLENIMEMFGISSKIKWHYARRADASNEKAHIEIY